MAFESNLAPESGKTTVNVQLHKGKEESTECNNLKGINLLSLVRKCYEEVLIRTALQWLKD